MNSKYLCIIALLLTGCGGGSEPTTSQEGELPSQEIVDTDTPITPTTPELEDNSDNKEEIGADPSESFSYQRIIASNVSALYPKDGVIDLTSLLSTDTLEQYPDKANNYYYDDNNNLKLRVAGGHGVAELTSTTSYQYNYSDSKLASVTTIKEYLTGTGSVRTTQDTWEDNLKTKYTYNHAVKGEDSISNYALNYNSDNKIAEKVRLYEDGSTHIEESTTYLENGDIDFYTTESLETSWSYLHNYYYDDFDRLAYIKKSTYKNDELNSTTLTFYLYNNDLNSITTFSVDEEDFNAESATATSSRGYISFTTYYYEDVEQCSAYQTLIDSITFSTLPQCKSKSTAPSTADILGIKTTVTTEVEDKDLTDTTQEDVESTTESHQFLRLKSLYYFSALHNESVHDYDLTPLLEDTTLDNLINDKVSFHDNNVFYTSAKTTFSYYDDGSLQLIHHNGYPQNYSISYDYLYKNESLSSITEVNTVSSYNQLDFTITNQKTWENGLLIEESEIHYNPYPDEDWDGYYSERNYRYEYNDVLRTDDKYKVNEDSDDTFISRVISLANGDIDEDIYYNNDGTVNYNVKYYYQNDDSLEYTELSYGDDDLAHLSDRVDYGYDTYHRLSYVTQSDTTDGSGNTIERSPSYYIYNNSQNAIINYQLESEYNSSGHIVFYGEIYLYESVESCGETIEYSDSNIAYCMPVDDLPSTQNLELIP